MSTKLKILLTSHCDFSWGIHPGPHFPLLEMLFFFFFLSREDANLHGGSGKEKEKVSACFHPQHLAQLSRGEDLKQTEQGRGLQRLSVPLGPGPHVACSALGLPSVLAPTTPCSLRALLLGPIFCSASLTSTQAPLEGGWGGGMFYSAPRSSAQAQYLDCRRQELGQGPSFSSPVSVSLSVPLLQFRFTLEHNRGCKSYYPLNTSSPMRKWAPRGNAPCLGSHSRWASDNNRRRTRCQVFQPTFPHSFCVEELGDFTGCL